VAIVLAVLDEGLENVFYTSTDALPNSPAMDLHAGESCSVTFKLKLHLATATFHLGVYLHRTDVDKVFDQAVPATTFFVATDPEVRGAANLYPVVTSIERGLKSGSTEAEVDRAASESQHLTTGEVTAS
jgi:hypothetical protein